MLRAMNLHTDFGIKRMTPKLVGRVRIPVGSYHLRDGTCRLSILVFGVNGWVKVKASHSVLPLPCYQYNIFWESSRVAHVAE